MPTNAQTQRKYEDARRALNNIARSMLATDAQVTAARKARTRLSREFIRQNIADVRQRTAQFSQFIRDIERVINRIGRNAPIRALDTLKAVVDSAKLLLR
ncbi:MAG: hypothetical protein IIA64_03760 [Planctomycetes bacterium]|nr:hypothetical protein [Planctomycetota bacterium]